MLKLIGGVLALLFGVTFGAYAIYAGFIADDPAVTLRRPIKGLIIAGTAICVGVYWIVDSRSAAKTSSPEGAPPTEA